MCLFVRAMNPLVSDTKGLKDFSKSTDKDACFYEDGRRCMQAYFTLLNKHLQEIDVIPPCLCFMFEKNLSPFFFNIKLR